MSSPEEEALRREAKKRLGKMLCAPWRFERLLGGGGTAWVYVVVNESDQRRAAAKVLHPHWAEDPDVRLRFLREGKVANAITHRGIVKVFDEGILDDGVPFLLMELLVGESLEDRWIRKGRKLAVKEVLWAADQILSVLAVAHARGTVHRDVKPDNVFVTKDRIVKLLDFGIARVTEHAEYAQALTRAGALLGTPAFLPPEQARGEHMAIGVKTDLWAVGATMFTLLSGRYVHEEERVIDQLIASTRKSAPSLGSVAPHVPQNVVDLVDFALQFDAKDRWPNASTMRHAIRLVYAEWAKTSLRDDGEGVFEESMDNGPRFLPAASAPPAALLSNPPTRVSAAGGGEVLARTLLAPKR